MKRLILVGFSAFLFTESKVITISKEAANKIGKQIYINECAEKPEYLVFWKDGEDVLSLGIGHFIWCPKDECIFDEGFPELRNFLIKNKVKVPKEFMGKCPWNSEIELNKSATKKAKLKTLMEETMDLQVKFMVSKLKIMLPYLLKFLHSDKEKSHVKFQFNRLVQSGPGGVYAAIDYPHFKGAGVKDTEQYNGKKWGFLQALKLMQGKEIGEQAVEEFSLVVKKLLKERVKNAPRKEEQWLEGWQNRIDTYKNFK